MAYLGMNIEHGAVLPTACDVFSQGNHRICIAGDTLAVEHGLDHASLAQVQLVFTGHKSIAHYVPEALQGVAFVEAGLSRDQHLLNALRVVEEIDSAPGCLEINIIAIC